MIVRTLTTCGVLASLAAVLGIQRTADPDAILLSETINDHAPYHSSHASTIVETAQHGLVAAWFGGTAERNPDVGIWVAHRAQNGWEPAVEVATGLQPDGKRYPTWNPVLFQAPNGLLFLFYKVGNSGIDAITLADGRVLLVYNHAANAAGRTTGPRYPLDVAISRDGLKWQHVLELEHEPRRDGYAYPAVIQTSDRLIHVTYTWDRTTIKHAVIDPTKLRGR